MPGDNVRKEPTLDEQMTKFKGFATQDGEIDDPSKENLNPTTKGLSPEEAKAGATLIEETPVEVAAEGEDKTKQPPPAPKKNAKPVGERIDEITRARRQAERALDMERAARQADNERWEARMKSLEDRVASGPLTPKAQGATADEDPDAPKATAYEYGEMDPKFVRDLARYTAKQELEAERKTQETQRTKAAQSVANAELMEKAKAFEEAGADAYEDFDEVVLGGARNDEWALTPTVGELILDSEHGVHIAYYLASNPKESRKVAAMKTLAQAKWFAAKEAEFSAGASAATGEQQSGESERQAPKQATQLKTAPKAPPPPPNRARGGQGTSTVSADTTDFAAFEAMTAGRTAH